MSRREGVGGFGCGAEMNSCADAIAQFEMPGNEIGVEMSEEDLFYGEAVSSGEGDVVVRVALGVDDDGGVGRFVADEVGGVRETG